MKVAIFSGLGAAALLTVSAALAFTTDWRVITTIKATDAKLIVYMDQNHTCGGSSGANSYRIDQAAEAQSKVAMAAFLSGRSVMLDYSCAASGQAAGAYINTISMNQ